MRISRLAAVTLGAGVIVAAQPFATTVPAGGWSYTKMNLEQRRILSGFASYELNAATATTPATGHPQNFFPSGFVFSCTAAQGGNIKVNQNCLNLSDPDLQGRAQAQ